MHLGCGFRLGPNLHLELGFGAGSGGLSTELWPVYTCKFQYKVKKMY